MAGDPYQRERQFIRGAEHALRYSVQVSFQLYTKRGRIVFIGRIDQLQQHFRVVFKNITRG
ncbi:hypothetical protein SDC9_192911 [bioreactor metagenome]|uniref:Uncharacterized protein n=1 Tax=bioreactor metagenome TaxID=1076179 RepID=A0A645IAI6_9ZZZZ